jgi:hypothetical protein
VTPSAHSSSPCSPRLRLHLRTHMLAGTKNFPELLKAGKCAH